MKTISAVNLNEKKLSQLKEKLSIEWSALKSRSCFIKGILQEPVDPRLYMLYMLQTYHYTAHNARNQALTGVIAKDVSPGYLKYCFDHAAEESGHEMMAVADLVSMGMTHQQVFSSPAILETDALIAYLYWISSTGNPMRRLGYSLWAESSYGFIGDVLTKVKGDLKLTARQMTFFDAHSDIDAEHAAEVDRALTLYCKTEADWQAVEHTMIGTLQMTERMLDGVWHTFNALRNGSALTFTFLDRVENLKDLGGVAPTH